MVGDCLTTADFELCLTLAAAGRLVLTCVHAADSATACERIAAAVGPAGQILLAQTLKGVIAQCLVPDAADARGCHAVAEVLVMSSALRHILKPNGDIDALRGHILNQKTGLDHALAVKCRKGEITEDDARSYSVDPEEFDSLLRRAIMF